MGAEMGMPRGTRLVTSGLVAALSVALVACSTGRTDKAGGKDQAAPVVLTFASNNGGTPSQLVAFIEGVQKLSGDTMRIDYHNSWRQGEPAQEVGLVQDIQQGKVDMGFVGARVFDSVGLKSFQALLAPLLVDSYDLEAKVFAAGIPTRMLQRVDTIGLVGIGVLPGPMRTMMGLAHPFAKPADFKGAVVGTSGGALAEEVFRVLGATPRMVPAVTTLDGLDGLDYSLSAIWGNLYYQQAKAVTANLDLWPRPLALVMNPARFGRLTKAQQEILRTAATEAVAPALSVTRGDETEGGRGLCATGMTLVQATEADLTAIKGAVEPIYAELETDPDTKAFLDQIRALKGQVAAPAESLTCPPSASAPSGAVTPLDGVFRMTLAPEPTPEEPRPAFENYGSFVYVFDRGRFATTQENDVACTWAYGTYTVTSDRLELSVLDGGGVAPTGAVNKVGERLVFGWSLYRGLLTLRGVPGEIPSPFRTETLRRGDEAPSASVLSARCPPPAVAFSAAAPPVGLPEGTYRTGELSVDQLVATGLAAGFARADVDPFVPGNGIKHSVVMTLRLAQGGWTLLEGIDGQPGTVGWEGSYQVIDDHTVVAKDSCGPITYSYVLAGDQLNLRVVHDGCPGVDELVAQTIIYQSGPFTRIGGP